jgi:PrtD family type I secretion system ABC transporter
MQSGAAKHLGFAFFSSTCAHALLLIPTLITLQIYDRVLSSRKAETLAMLLVAAALALAAWWAVEGARSRWFAAQAAAHEDALSTQLGALAQRLQLERNPKANAQLWHDMSTARSLLGGPVAMAVVDSPWALVYMLIITAFHPLLGAVALLGIVLLALLAWFTDHQLKAAVGSAELAQASAVSASSETAQFAEIAQAHGQAAQVAAAQAAMRAQANAQRLAAELPSHGLKTLGKLARQVLQIAMLAVGALLVMSGQATGGVMIAGSILLGKALMPLEVLIGSFKQIVQGRDAFARLKQAQAKAAELASSAPHTGLPEPAGALRIEALTVNRPSNQSTAGSQANTAAPVLHNIHLALPAGAMLAVLGASGSGKTTLARALVGAQALSSGQISLDGAALAQYHDAVRGQFTGYLPQDLQLHSGRVADTIARRWLPQGLAMQDAPEPDNSQAVIAAAKLAGAHELITSLPQGYDTRIGHEAGAVPLSGGQRQRVALARAVYGMPRLVVLDEPNSQLDAEGELALEQCLRALAAAGCTVMAITHRPHLVELASHVLLLRGGVVDQFGPKEQVRQWMAQRNQLAMKRSAQA